MKIYLKISCFVLLYCILCVNISKASTPVKWATKVVESTMYRNFPASELGSWSYQKGFYLYSQYRVWQKIRDDSYFQYIRDWLDDHISDNGNIDRNMNSLDNMQPGLITLYCYEETGEQKYMKAAERIRTEFDTYPRTTDSGLWHKKDKDGQLWLDGVYMSLPFLMKYGQLFGDSTYCFDEASQQIIIYASHLKDTTGLLYHGYDEDGSEGWADPVTHRSPEFWGRSMGWFGMAIIEILEMLPENHPNRAKLIEILSDLISGLAKYQDKETGLWYQVTNKGDKADNWLETSCSCMYTFFTARAVERGYVDSSYIEVALKGYEGILTKISLGNDGLTYLKDISQGTSVGVYNYYVNRSRNTNDLHGLGAFLLASVEMSKYADYFNVNQLPNVTISSPANFSFFAVGSDIPISITAFDMDGVVERIEVYEGDSLLFTDDQEPWEYVWQNVPEGDYVLIAVAFDDSNASNTSSPINVIVTNDSLVFQAEDATISEGSVDSNHPGYTGTGFVNLVNKIGTYLEWTLALPAAGNWAFKFRFANGSSNNRLCKMDVNWIVVDNAFNFESTGSWENWRYSRYLNAEFKSGSNNLKVTGITSESAPNLDFVMLFRSTSLIEEKPIRPYSFALYPNYPNPFNPNTTIKYSVKDPRHIKLTVFNLLGNHVATLVDESKSPGIYTADFDASQLSSGIYVYKLQAGNMEQTRKMLLVK